MLGALGAVIIVGMLAALVADDPDAAVQLAVVYLIVAVWSAFGFSLFGAVDQLLSYI